MGALGFNSILVVVSFLGILSGVHSHRSLGSSKPLPHKNLKSWSLESRDSPVTNVPKYLNREDAKRISAARWKLTRSLAGEPRIDNAKGESQGRLFYVTNYGADPTGARDNTRAILAAINESFNVATREHTMSGVRNLGGVEIVLEGGSYLISKPLRLPRSGGANVLIHGGTLWASDDFREDRYLIELWSSTDAKINLYVNLAAGERISLSSMCESEERKSCNLINETESSLSKSKSSTHSKSSRSLDPKATAKLSRKLL